MNATKEPAEARAADEARPQPDERARARLYLDLWERHLVQAAVRYPAPAGGRSPA